MRAAPSRYLGPVDLYVLLAEVAGVLEGTSEAGLDGSLARQAAGLCRSAGADPEVIPAWVEEGRRRRAAARMPPLPGGLHLGHRMLLPPVGLDY